LAEQFEHTQSVTVVIENRPGGAGVIGAEAVSRAAADGATLLLANPSIIINSLLRKQSYDPLTSFEPICNLVILPLFVAVNSASPYQSLANFLDAARTKPGQLTLASLTATVSHIGFEMLKRRANVDITFVPFPGGAPAVTALLGGHVSSMIDNYGTIAEQVSGGKLRAVATLSRSRVEDLPDVPTVAESGYSGFEADGWFGLFAPSHLRKETASQIAQWTTAGLKAPELRRRLALLAMHPTNMCGTDFDVYIRKQYETFGRAVQEANMKAE
jgi:tripartite-type tricarboxylate transporter receptor subunit TctC